MEEDSAKVQEWACIYAKNCVQN
ncbi:Protein of unknown function [Bacillus toyonensis]|nr:Protein of unknown function [Bacillus toyonensis]